MRSASACSHQIIMRLLRGFIDLNVRMSRAFDRLLPNAYSIDGNQDFVNTFAPDYIRPGLYVVDVGGGKRPFISVETKIALELRVLGVDISQNELDRAPKGAYDEVVCTDITRYRGKGEADLVICQAVLEHVKDVQAALASISSILRPGGVAVIFVPSRNAVFARLNLILPEGLKRRLLHFIYPHMREGQGFPSYYDRCTPRDFCNMAVRSGLVIGENRYYFESAYFTFFFPAHMIWRLWVVLFRSLVGNQAAETFSLVMAKSQ